MEFTWCFWTMIYDAPSIDLSKQFRRRGTCFIIEIHPLGIGSALPDGSFIILRRSERIFGGSSTEVAGKGQHVGGPSTVLPITGHVPVAGFRQVAFQGQDKVVHVHHPDGSLDLVDVVEQGNGAAPLYPAVFIGSLGNVQTAVHALANIGGLAELPQQA